MYIIKVNTGHETLTYTFHSESSGKSGNDSLGVNMFISAFRKYFADSRERVTVRVMNEAGGFCDVGGYTQFISPADYDIVLAAGKP